jgi:hypothetical protein
MAMEIVWGVSTIARRHELDPSRADLVLERAAHNPCYQDRMVRQLPGIEHQESH